MTKPIQISPMHKAVIPTERITTCHSPNNAPRPNNSAPQASKCPDQAGYKGDFAITRPKITLPMVYRIPEKIKNGRKVLLVYIGPEKLRRSGSYAARIGQSIVSCSKAANIKIVPSKATVKPIEVILPLPRSPRLIYKPTNPTIPIFVNQTLRVSIKTWGNQAFLPGGETGLSGSLRKPLGSCREVIFGCLLTSLFQRMHLQWR
jgi:hypothetical protein